jgi:hypothetical protein
VRRRARLAVDETRSVHWKLDRLGHMLTRHMLASPIVISTTHSAKTDTERLKRVGWKVLLWMAEKILGYLVPMAIGALALWQSKAIEWLHKIGSWIASWL